MFAELPDVRMYYEDVGEGEPVILIAGLGTNHRFWKTMVPLLEGYRVITLDNRGVGDTEYTGEITVEGMGDDIIHLMDHLGIARAHILGWSMGAHIAQSLAARYQDRVQSLTIVSGYQFRPYRSSYFMYMMIKAAMEGRCTMDEVNVVLNSFCFPEATFEYLEKQDIIMPVPKHPEDPAQIYAQMMSTVNYDTTGMAKDITAPTMVIHGGEDIMVEPKKGRAMAESIGAEYFEIPGEGHTITPERHVGILRKHFEKNRME